jgi:hypothetical protein
LVTPRTSMLVLDSLEQYLKYEVEPPKNLEFYSKYMEISKLRSSRAGIIFFEFPSPG